MALCFQAQLTRTWMLSGLRSPSNPELLEVATDGVGCGGAACRAGEAAAAEPLLPPVGGACCCSSSASSWPASSSSACPSAARQDSVRADITRGPCCQQPAPAAALRLPLSCWAGAGARVSRGVCSAILGRFTDHHAESFDTPPAARTYRDRVTHARHCYEAAKLHKPDERDTKRTSAADLRGRSRLHPWGGCCFTRGEQEPRTVCLPAGPSGLTAGSLAGLLSTGQCSARSARR